MISVDDREDRQSGESSAERPTHAATASPIIAKGKRVYDPRQMLVHDAAESGVFLARLEFVFKGQSLGEAAGGEDGIRTHDTALDRITV